MLTPQEEAEIMQKAAEMVKTLSEALNESSKKLNEASQKITEQALLIEHLSKDNLALVAKLDALTGKNAPDKTHSA